MIIATFPDYAVLRSVELPQVSKYATYDEAGNKLLPPDFEEVKTIAEETLTDLEYRISVRECAGEMSRARDFFIEFPKTGRFISLAANDPESYTATINVSWRASKGEMERSEREAFIAFLKKYFKVA